MKTAISTITAAAASAILAQPASTDKTFDRCITVATTMMESLNFPKIQRTKFGVTGETAKDTVFGNCEDHGHVSIVLMRASRPQVEEIDALAALLQQLLDASAP